MASGTELTNALEVALARELDGFVTLEGLQKLTAGASQETYRITVRLETGQTRLALRRSQPTGEDESGVGALSLATEAKLIRLASSGGVPGPEILYVLQPADGLGPGFIMEWLEGDTLGQRINRSEHLAEIRPQLAYECGRILGRIHNLDWEAAGLADELPCVDPAHLVKDTFAIYQNLSVPEPMIDYCWRWLNDNLPQNSRRTLVHGDFRNGNLMVTPAGIRAVLDWELAQVGDPVRDLGWICVNSWRFGNADMPVGGFGQIADLLEGYSETSGLAVNPNDLTFWQVFGSFWWSIVTLQMANAWRTGEAPSLERPVIGRRSSEAQMDCVQLLIPGDLAVPPMETKITEGTQLPMPAELVSGVADFLREVVADRLDSQEKFLAKVAANSLGIAQRELQFGPLLAAREKQRLCELLNAEEDLDRLREKLSTSLRNGMSLTTPGLAEHLRQTVAGQLAIDQPGYSALASVTDRGGLSRLPQ